MDKTTVFSCLWCTCVFAYLIAFIAYTAAFVVMVIGNSGPILNQI